MNKHKLGNKFIGAFLFLILLIGWLIFCCTRCEAQTVVNTNQYNQTFRGQVTLNTDAPITFYGCTFIGQDVQSLLSISAYQNVTCMNCRFVGKTPTRYGEALPVGIWATEAYKLYLYTCHFENLSDWVFVNGNWTVGTDIMFWGCHFEAANNRQSDGRGGWLTTTSWPGSGVCFFRVRGYNYGNGIHQFRIENCTLTNIPGIDEGGDLLNVYESCNLICQNNVFTGGVGTVGPNVNGNSIVTDDEWSDAWQTRGQIPGDPNWTTSNCVFQGNRINDGRIGVWAGHDNQFLDNTVTSSGATAVGIEQDMYCVARYTPEGITWAQSNVVSGNTAKSSLGQVWDYVDNAGGINWTNNVK